MRISWRPQRWERVSLAVLGILAVVAFLVGMRGWKEATRAPEVVRYDVAAPGLARDLRIVLVGDTHMGGWPNALDGVRVGQLVQQVREFDPDLVVLAGDYVAAVGRTEGGFPAAVAPFSGLAATYGVVGVLGNHDYEEGDARTLGAQLRAAGIAPLVNDHVDLGPVVVAGLDDLWKGDSDIGVAQRALADARGRPVVLVSHNPDVFPQVPSGVLLTLAAHTHGGQVVLPLVGQVMSSSRFGPRYRRGLVMENGRAMVVTSGAGGAAMRLGVPPEIAVVTLRAARARPTAVRP